jgi:hypothetical protein
VLAKLPLLHFNKSFLVLFFKKEPLSFSPAPRVAQGPARSNVVIALQMQPRRGD